MPLFGEKLRLIDGLRPRPTPWYAPYPCCTPVHRSPAIALLIVAGAALFIDPPKAQAPPSYARQTGQQCPACHNGFPELTPYGRLFKLNGYVFGGGQSDLPALAAMLVPSFTHTDSGQAGGAATHYGPNDNFATPQSGSLFYGGAISS